MSGAIALFLLSYSLPTLFCDICIAIAGCCFNWWSNLITGLYVTILFIQYSATGLGMALGVGRLGAILGPNFMWMVTEFKFTHQL